MLKSRLYKLAAIVAFITIALDQITKLWVRFGPLEVCNEAVQLFSKTGTMPFCNEQLTLLPYLNIRLHLNPGISFSMFSGGGDVGRWVLSAIAVVICLFLIFYLSRELRRWFAIGTGFIVGGAIGNLIDRLYIGAVVDFIDFHIGDFHPFIFNIADAGVAIGITCLLIDTFFFQPKNDGN